MLWKGVIDKYRQYLPVTDKTPVITLQEGNTPLIRADRLAEEIGAGFEIYLKFEGMNPTGSFKDRGMTVAVSRAKERGAKAVMCASTGNTSASAAAYAARARLDCFVLIPAGGIALGKLAQALVYGAKVIAIDGNFDDALRIVREITSRYEIVLVNSLNPDRIEGQKTGSFEICEQLKGVPDYHVIPVGNAGNITAYWKGYKEYKEIGKITALPKMCGFQAEGAAPIVRGTPIKDPQTIATAIKIGNPASWKQAETAAAESGGLIDCVSDEEIVGSYQMLASLEGVFVEPASAASVAGLIKLDGKGYFDRGKRVVCVLTGHGLKDPDRAIKTVGEPATVPAIMDAVLEAMGIS